jgi:hypothetical protein
MKIQNRIKAEPLASIGIQKKTKSRLHKYLLKNKLRIPDAAIVTEAVEKHLDEKDQVKN